MSVAIADYSQAVDITGLAPAGSVTRPELVITEANVPASMLDAGLLSCLSGGGDIRIASDGTGATQYAIDVRRCVTSETPSLRELEIRVRPESYSSSSRSVTIFYGNVGGSQPAPESTYGRDSVYTENLSYFTLSESANTDANGYKNIAVSDNTRNATGISTFDSATPTPWGAGCLQFNKISGQTVVSDHEPIQNLTEYTQSVWARLVDDAADSAPMTFADSDAIGGNVSFMTAWWNISPLPAKHSIAIKSFFKSYDVNCGSDIVVPTIDKWQLITARATATTLYSYIDGVETGSVSIPSTPFDSDVGFDRLRFGNWLTGRGWDGQLADGKTRGDAFDINREQIEYTNQFDPASFWATSAAYDPNGGGGTTISADSITSTPVFESVSLTQDNVLAVSDMTVSASFETVVVQLATILVVPDIQAQALFKSVSLVQQSVLAADDILSQSVFDSVSLTTGGILVVPDIQSIANMDSISISQSSALSVNDISSTAGMESISLSQSHILNVSDIVSSANMDGVTLEFGLFLSVSDVISAATFEDVSLTQAHIITVPDISVSTDMEEAGLVTSVIVAPNNMESQAALESISLDQSTFIQVQDILGQAVMDQPSLIQSNILVVSDIESSPSFAGITFSGAVFNSRRLVVIQGFSRIIKIQ